jgi:hypothetical protein
MLLDRHKQAPEKIERRQIMRNISKLFRTVALAAIVSMLLVAIPISSVLAAASIELDPEEGEIGERIDIEGDGFSGEEDVEVDIYFSSEEADKGDDIDDEVENYERVKSGVTVDEDGEFSTNFRVPDELTDGDEDEEVHGGTYYVYVTYSDEDNIEAVAEFTVIAGEIELDPDDGPVGTEVEISGTGFTDNEVITVEYDDDEVDIASGDEETDRDGEFVCTIIIPESTAGDHTITVTDDSGSSDEANFSVEPVITVTSTGTTAGETVEVSGTGFGKDVEVIIKLDGEEIAEGETDSYGSFEIPFTLSEKTSDTYVIEATDEDDNTGKVDFTIAVDVKLSQTTGNVGGDITVTGTGFAVNQAITIKYDATQVATATSDSKGSFSISFSVPESEHGEHTITVADASGRTDSKSFVMESTPPAKPTLSLPANGTRIGFIGSQTPTFQWTAVTDPSGVNYVLQIASDPGFFSLVVPEVSGLTEASYTLPQGRGLPYGDYYWRVKAIDGAQNDSGWSPVYSFQSGLLPLWAFIVSIVLIVVLGGVLVYLFVMRR